MRVQIQNLILKFISENPGTQISAVVSNLPDVDRSSVSSALTRLTMQGKITRSTGKNKRFTYCIAVGEGIPAVAKTEPVHITAVVPKKEIISQEEWEGRFSKAEALLEKGLPRRASRAFLELLDVTGEATLRERIIRCRARCGCRPSGDGSMMAGRFVGVL